MRRQIILDRRFCWIGLAAAPEVYSAVSHRKSALTGNTPELNAD